MTEACISATMESYLMMLYVTLEQESALKNFFVDHGWTFCKPDLTVTTDRLGPAVRDVQADSVPSEGDFNPRLLGKRKVRRKQNKAPVIKLAKIIPAPSSSKTNVQTLDNVQADSDISEQLDDEPNEAELQDIGDIEGSSNVGPKIKAETLDSSFNEDYDDDNDDNEDDDDDDIDTDVDESYEEAKADGEMEADVTERDEAEDETGVTEEAVRTKASKQKRTCSTRKKVLRNYSPTSLVAAYNLVEKSNVSVYKAAKIHGIPISTLRDRVDRRISIDTTKSGPDPILSPEQEERLCTHIKGLDEVGYGYTRSEVISHASDYAVALGKRTLDKPLTHQWYYDFRKRWPGQVKLSSLSEQRKKCADETSVKNYYTELARIMTEYDLHDKPQNIYHIDERSMSMENKPPNAVAGSPGKYPAIKTELSKTVTVIGAGSALGVQLPPYIVFPGEKYLDKLMKGKTTGADGTMTKSGSSDSNVLRKYFKNHFVKCVQGIRDGDDTILVLYDGHKSHISVDLIDWGFENNMVLFVLPPHTSHIVESLDVGCFGSLQSIYSHECITFTRMNHRVVTRYDACSLACKAYIQALAPSNLQASFKRAGIYPLLDGSTMCQKLGLNTSTVYEENVIECSQPDSVVDL